MYAYFQVNLWSLTRSSEFQQKSLEILQYIKFFRYAPHFNPISLFFNRFFVVEKGKIYHVPKKLIEGNEKL